MKKLYVSAWFLLTAAASIAVLSGAMNAAIMVAFSLVALGLVHALALWSVFTNTNGLQTE